MIVEYLAMLLRLGTFTLYLSSGYTII